MTKTVDLVSYLPTFMAEFKEVSVTLEAENPEFLLVWNAAERVLYNEFITTADEYGITRFEKLLGILPCKEDTLESRRLRVQTRWFHRLPFTWRMFLEQMVNLCGKDNFKVRKDFDFYKVIIEVHFSDYGKVEELDYLMQTMLPVNMVINSKNNIDCVTDTNGKTYCAGCACVVRRFYITNDFTENHHISANAKQGGGLQQSHYIIISDEVEERRR